MKTTNMRQKKSSTDNGSGYKEVAEVGRPLTTIRCGDINISSMVMALSTAIYFNGLQLAVRFLNVITN